MIILDGRKLADEILDKIRKKINKEKLKLTLGVIWVGNDKVSEGFISQKKIACEKVGINFKLFKFPLKIKEDELKREIKKIVKNPNITGIIIQLPLPKRLNAEEYLNLIPEHKDVDVLSEESLGKFYQGVLPILPPTVGGILGILIRYRINLKGKNVVIIGAGRLVGLPLAIQFLREKATTSIINKSTKDVFSFTKKADILISGVGKLNLIKGNMVKKGVIIIDAGSAFKNGKIYGDVDFNSVIKKVKYITPVPGGVGPMTVSCLIENLVDLNKK